MDTKICFKCNIEKPLSEFYKHPKMADGHLGKCKECTKSDVKNKYEENIQSIDYVEKERARGRDKYARLGYKNTSRSAHRDGSNAKRYMRSKGLDIGENELHHWDYNMKYDVFILSRRAHKLIHKYLVFDPDSNQFFSDGVLIDTKKKHYDLLLSVFKKHNVTYQIDSYPISID